MSTKMISVSCPYCSKINVFSFQDLQSGIPIKDDEGNIVEEYPEVDLEEGILIKCEYCGGPIPCSEDDII